MFIYKNSDYIMTNKEKVLNKAVLEHLYWGKKLSTIKIGRMFNIDHQRVRYLALTYGIKLRPPRGS